MARRCRRPTTCRRSTRARCACFDAAAARAMVDEVDAAQARTATPSAASSRCSPTACRPGLGSHVHWDRRLDSRLAAALMGIQAIKGVEVGDGFESARRRGSQVMDEIVRGADGLEPHQRPARRHRGRHVHRRGRCACAPR